MAPPPTDLWNAWRTRGDAVAFERLVAPHLPVLYDVARRQGLPRPEAEDAVQDALAELARQQSSRPVEVGVAPWLVRSVRLRASTLRRSAARRARHESSERAARSEGPPEPGAALEAHEQVERALETLGDDDRQVLLLRHRYDLEYREMAYVLGVSEEACRVRVHRATSRLRDRLGPNAVVLLTSPAFEVPAHAAQWVAVATTAGPTAGGGLAFALTAVKLGGGAVAVLAVAAVTWWGVASLGEHGEEPTPAPVTRDHRTPGETSPPLLVGRGSPNSTTTVEGEETERSQASDEVPVRVTPPLTMERLLADIRKHAAPDFWEGIDPSQAMRNTGPYAIVLRAPPDVQEAVHEYLDRRRARAQGVVEEAPDSSVDVARARRGLSRILLRVLSRAHRLRQAVTAISEDRATDARGLLEEVLVEEPDNTIAADLLEALVVEGAGGAGLHKAAGEASTLLYQIRNTSSLGRWKERWPSEATSAAIERVTAGVSVDALRVRGPELEDVLERGSVSLDVEDASLRAVLRELEIRTFARILCPLEHIAYVDRRRVRNLRIRGRSLGEALDRVFASLPPVADLSWESNPRLIRVLWRGERPKPVVQIHSVADLLEPGAVVQEPYKPAIKVAFPPAGR